jgi:hypothetical protein
LSAVSPDTSALVVSVSYYRYADPKKSYCQTLVPGMLVPSAGCPGPCASVVLRVCLLVRSQGFRNAGAVSRLPPAQMRRTHWGNAGCGKAVGRSNPEPDTSIAACWHPPDAIPARDQLRRDGVHVALPGVGGRSGGQGGVQVALGLGRRVLGVWGKGWGGSA